MQKTGEGVGHGASPFRKRRVGVAIDDFSAQKHVGKQKIKNKMVEG
jgi:hypothetical protein